MRKSTLRKIAAISLSVGLILTASGCNRGDPAALANRVTLAVSTLNNPFFVDLRDGAKTAADAAGFNLQIVDAQNDSTNQVNQLNTAQSINVKGVLLNPVDSDSAGAGVIPLNKSNIPVIAIDRAVNGAETASLVASDNLAGGRQAADALAAAMGGQGTVAVLQGVAGTSASRDRGQGFAEGIAKYPNITVVATQTANFDRAQALDVATNLLQANPKITGIFAENDEMALGAVQAMGAKAGTQIKIVGFDGTEDGIAAVKAGTLSGTIAQQPKLLGKTAVELLVKVLAGTPIEATVPIPVSTVTKENVDRFTE